MANINYDGELTSMVAQDGTTVLTIKGKIKQIIEQEMIEETSAFELKYKDGRKATVTSDRSPALFVNGDPNGEEALYNEDEIDEIVRVESAQAASSEIL